MTYFYFKFCIYLFLYSKCWLLHENREDMVGNAPTSETKDRWGGAGGWLLSPSAFTEVLKRDWDLPGTRFDDMTPFCGRFKTPDDEKFVSAVDASVELV